MCKPEIITFDQRTLDIAYNKVKIPEKVRESVLKREEAIGSIRAQQPGLDLVTGRVWENYK